jgi:hypothetical protein
VHHCGPRYRPVRFRLSLAAVALLPLSIGLGALSNASAQIITVETSQPDLVKKSASEQAEILAGIVRGTWKTSKCAHATASLEKTYTGGAGGLCFAMKTGTSGQ